MVIYDAKWFSCCGGLGLTRVAPLVTKTPNDVLRATYIINLNFLKTIAGSVDNSASLTMKSIAKHDC